MFRVTLIVVIAAALCGALAALFHFLDTSIFGLITTATLYSVFKDVALICIMLAAFCLLIAVILRLLFHKK